MAAATKKQVALIRELLDEKELTLEPGVTVDDLKAAAERIDWQRASRWIDELLKRPRKLKSEDGRVADSVKYAHVPNGRYALEDPSDELNPVKFYRIKHGGPAKHAGGRDWTGFVFVDRYSSDETFAVKGATKTAVLEAIGADPLSAAQRYGREHKTCGICGRGLTRALSRELGIGPVCGARIGIPDEVVAAARQSLLDRGIDPDQELPEDDHYWDAQMQLKEREEDERVARQKMERDAQIGICFETPIHDCDETGPCHC